MDRFDGEAFEAFGEWFFDKEAKVPNVGTLKFDPKLGLELRVVDPTRKSIFSPILPGKSLGGPVHAFGRSHSHGHISLFDGFVRSTPASSHGPAETICYFNHGLLGIAQAEAGKIRVDSVHATCDLLRVFLDRQLVKFKGPPISRRRTVTLLHNLPRPEKHSLNLGTTLEFAWTREGPNHTIAQCDISIHSKPWIGLKYRKLKPLDRALSDLSCANRLLSTLSGFEFRADVIQVGLRKKKSDAFRPGPLYFLAATHAPGDRSKDRIPSDLLFRHGDIQARFQGIARRWFELNQKIPGCLNTFFSANYSAYTNQRLFALTTVLEAMHRQLKAKKSTLRDRIIDCINDFSSLMNDVVEDPSGFAARVVKHRNSEAHCNEDGAQGSGSEHARLAAKLRVLIDAIILNHLGISVTDFEPAMRKSREYWFYAANATWKWNAKP